MRETIPKKKKNIGFILKELGAYNAHVKPIVDNNPKDSFLFFVFHLNSYYTPSIDVQDDRVTFIALSIKTNYKRILKENNIDFIVSISPGNIFDLFFLSICKIHQIPTAYYQHGIQLDFASFNPQSLYQAKSMKRKLLSLKKYLFFYSIFIKNILLNKRKKFLINTIRIKTLHLLNKKALSKLPKYGIKENHCDFAFVYGRNDKEYLQHSMKMEPDKIIISGYPFVPLSDSQPKKTGKTALFLSTALRSAGVIPITIAQEKEYYNKIFKEVTKAGYNLVLKLHPLEDEDLFHSYFRKNTVAIIRHANLADLTYSSDVVIGEYTTAFFYPIKYLKPIFIVKSEFFNEYPFDYTKYGIGFKTNIDQLALEIGKHEQLNKKQKDNYTLFLKNYIISYNGDDSFKLFFQQISNALDQNEDVII